MKLGRSTIIGFGYRSRSGKDSAVAAIVQCFGHSVENYVRRYALADALKREVTAAAIQHGGMEQLIIKEVASGRIPAWVTYDPNAPMDDPLCPLGKQRKLLQWWGTDYRRIQYEDYWVDQLKSTIDNDKPTFALVTDFRFENESKIMDFKVRIDRPGIQVLDHPSEHALDSFEDWDLVIPNNCDLASFRINVLRAFDFIRDYQQGRAAFYDRQVGQPR